MTDTELIKKLKENNYDTEIIICDTEGNEYEIKEVSLTMGGQFHQVIKLEKYDKSDNWFRTLDQKIEECEKQIAYYESQEFLNECNKLPQKDAELLIDHYKGKGMEHLKYCLSYYKNLKNKEKDK